MTIYNALLLAVIASPLIISIRVAGLVTGCMVVALFYAGMVYAAIVMMSGLPTVATVIAGFTLISWGIGLLAMMGNKERQ